MNILSNKLDEIKKELQALIEIVDGLKSYDEIPSIDVDLMKHKMLNSYNNVINLNKKDTVNEATESVVEENNTEPEIELELIEKVEDAPEETKEFYENIVEEIKEAIKKDEEETQEEAPEIIKEDTIKKEETTTATATESTEKVKEEAPINKTVSIDKSVKSVLSSIFQEIQNESNSASITQFTAISDVKAAISINEKIGFISDIFAGDNNKFNDCLDKINNIEDINILISELDNATEWDIENHNHKMFLEVVYRKFI